jgi:hypothetical protein
MIGFINGLIREKEKQSRIILSCLEEWEKEDWGKMFRKEGRMKEFWWIMTLLKYI